MKSRFLTIRLPPPATLSPAAEKSVQAKAELLNPRQPATNNADNFFNIVISPLTVLYFYDTVLIYLYYIPIGIPYAIPWIKEVKTFGRGVYFLSNYSPFAQCCNPNCLDFLPYMDGGIFSCDVKHIKPYKDIYKDICNTYHLNPEECIFIDENNEANVKAAIEFGMHAIQFTRYEETKLILDEQLKIEE